MNVGSPPEPGGSRLTLHTYRVDRNGLRMGCLGPGLTTVELELGDTAGSPVAGALPLLP